jgi:hypothetical protein
MLKRSEASSVQVYTLRILCCLEVTTFQAAMREPFISVSHTNLALLNKDRLSLEEEIQIYKIMRHR